MHQIDVRDYLLQLDFLFTRGWKEIASINYRYVMNLHSEREKVTYERRAAYDG